MNPLKPYQQKAEAKIKKFTDQLIAKSTPPTYYETIVNSQQWEDWVKYNEDSMEWDVYESMETGWLSDGHFQAFIKFCKRDYEI